MTIGSSWKKRMHIGVTKKQIIPLSTNKITKVLMGKGLCIKRKSKLKRSWISRNWWKIWHIFHLSCNHVLYSKIIGQLITRNVRDCTSNLISLIKVTHSGYMPYFSTQLALRSSSATKSSSFFSERILTIYTLAYTNHYSTYYNLVCFDHYNSFFDH